MNNFCMYYPGFAKAFLCDKVDDPKEQEKCSFYEEYPGSRWCKYSHKDNKLTLECFSEEAKRHIFEPSG